MSYWCPLLNPTRRQHNTWSFRSRSLGSSSSIRLIFLSLMLVDWKVVKIFAQTRLLILQIRQLSSTLIKGEVIESDYRCTCDSDRKSAIYSDKLKGVCWVKLVYCSGVPWKKKTFSPMHTRWKLTTTLLRSPSRRTFSKSQASLTIKSRKLRNSSKRIGS